MSDPSLSDIDFKNQMAWVWSDSGLPFQIRILLHDQNFSKKKFLEWFTP